MRTMRPCQAHATLLAGLLLLGGCSWYPEEEDLSVDGIKSIPVLEGQINSDLVKTPAERVILAEQIFAKMQDSAATQLVPLLVSRLVALHPDDPYLPWYLYMAARSHERLGDKASAIFGYRRVYHASNDILVGGQSIRFLAIQKLLDYDEDRYNQIELQKTLIEHFADRIDPGLAWYNLALAYEAAGLFKDSFAAYRSYLSYPGTIIPQKPNEEKRVQEMLQVAETKKNWTRSSLDQLLAEIRHALSVKDVDKLLALQTRVNFFSMSWLQEKNDYNSQANYNFKRFLETSKHIYTDPELDSSSNSREAYLKTWGWNTYIPTWFLYFRRVNFPADPDIHGNWEWAGIYFGDSLQ